MTCDADVAFMCKVTLSRSIHAHHAKHAVSAWAVLCKSAYSMQIEIRLPQL